MLIRLEGAELGEGDQLLQALQKAAVGIDEHLDLSSLQLFPEEDSQHIRRPVEDVEPNEVECDKTLEEERDESDDKEQENSEEENETNEILDDNTAEKMVEDSELPAEDVEMAIANPEGLVNRLWKTVALPIVENLADRIYQNSASLLVDGTAGKADDDLFFNLASSGRSREEQELNKDDSSKSFSITSDFFTVENVASDDQVYHFDCAPKYCLVEKRFGIPLYCTQQLWRRICTNRS